MNPLVFTYFTKITATPYHTDAFGNEFTITTDASLQRFIDDLAYEHYYNFRHVQNSVVVEALTITQDEWNALYQLCKEYIEVARYNDASCWSIPF